MDEKISKLFLPLLDKLYNTEPAGEPFRRPVDVVKYGCYDYYLYVKHPIDLSTIKDRLVNNEYQQDAWRFVADVQLMFSNAYLFNKRGTPVYEFTNKLNKIWNSELTTIMQKLNYCCGTLYKFGPQLLFCHGTTTEKYCQIPIGAKYKCYQDQYSFCVPCFNRIESEFINIQNLSCETSRMTLPAQPVKKSDFLDCANDNWQYESFINCSQCSRRTHQICELYPASADELQDCIQHDKIEEEQKLLSKVPEEYRVVDSSQDEQSSDCVVISENDDNKVTSETQSGSSTTNQTVNQSEEATITSGGSVGSTDVDSSEESTVTPGNQSDNNSENQFEEQERKEKVNKIEKEQDENNMTKTTTPLYRDKFVCNHCYRKKKIGFSLRHRKFSARRLPHTRMSRYIETKVNEYIREHTPSAGEVTIKVLTAYRDTINVKPEMNDYLNKCRENSPFQHPNIENYPKEFNYMNRAIFAWQEIDGVDVCVFGMHVQEYGEDCPEPNRQVVYLSYLDSVHFFRPKQYRTAVYHEILLSYFKYVKKLGFRRVFIWVCPSRKGDDYIFYRHPTEQKMPTLKRLSDWYVSLLDKGVKAGIVEKHENIHQFTSGQTSGTSILSMPYLSGDYWPGEFERLLKIMIESQKVYETKMKQNDRKDVNHVMKSQTLNDFGECSGSNYNNYNPLLDRQNLERNNILSLTNIYQKIPPTSNNGNIFNTTKNSPLQRPYTASRQTATSSFSSITATAPERPSNFSFNADLGGDFSNRLMSEDFLKLFDNPSTPDSSTLDSEQPLDLSKSSNNTSPDSYFDEDLISELNCSVAAFTNSTGRKRRRKSISAGYVKKRNRRSTTAANTSASQLPCSFNGLNFNPHSSFYDSVNRFSSQSSTTKSSRQRLGNQSKDIVAYEHILTPEEELIKNLERSLKRQRDGFIVARLNDCECSPHFESQRRKEETTFTCELMKGREPFLQLARSKNYEFSTLRRAKFSSLAMVKHLGQYFKLDPICNECFSFDSSKRHFACSKCDDYYLCTSCHENTQHEHIMSLMDPSVAPDIDDFLQQCSLASTTNSISSASSTISNKSFTESNLDFGDSLLTTTNASFNAYPSLMPLSSKKEKNQSYGRVEDEENADICSFDAKTRLLANNNNNQPVPPPSHSANSIRSVDNINVELDQVLVENFIRHAEVSYQVDFDEMKNESKKLLTHYHTCPMKETCRKCKFVVLSCSFMSVLMKSTRMQMMLSCDASEIVTGNNNNINQSIVANNNTNNNNNGGNHPGGINLTTGQRKFSYQPNDK